MLQTALYNELRNTTVTVSTHAMFHGRRAMTIEN